MDTRLGIGVSLENDVVLNHGGYLTMLALLLTPDVFHLLSSNAGFVKQLECRLRRMLVAARL